MPSAPGEYSMFVDRDISLEAGCFQLDRPRKQDIVLEMDVLVKVLLEILQPVIERVVGRARIVGCSEVVAQAANFSN